MKGIDFYFFGSLTSWNNSLLWFRLFQLAIKVKIVCRGGIGPVAVGRSQSLSCGLCYQSDWGFLFNRILNA